MAARGMNKDLSEPIDNVNGKFSKMQINLLIYLSANLTLTLDWIQHADTLPNHYVL